MLTIKDLFDLDHTIAADYLSRFTYPWEALAGIKDFILSVGPTLEGYDEVSPQVWVHKTATVAPTAYLGSALVGAGCVVGNSVELKNVILFDGVQTPHYNYVGDSILGYKSHMGAGSITSNVKSDKLPVVVRCGQERMDTGRKKVGAMLGDFVEVGCNSVLNPGTVIGRHSIIYPTSCVRGVLAENSIHKNDGTVITRK